ncbi:hypothetical protein EBESD8_12940 [Rhodococcus aetherivorans]|nr:hypothetical protein EBESD8_12940 [Rhodococcus aetherivorans]
MALLAVVRPHGTGPRRHLARTAFLRWPRRECESPVRGRERPAQALRPPIQYRPDVVPRARRRLIHQFAGRSVTFATSRRTVRRTRRRLRAAETGSPGASAFVRAC